MTGTRVGSWVGVIAGLVFVMVNAEALPGPLPLAVRITGTCAAALAALVVMRAPAVATPTPPRHAIHVYLWSVTAMVVAIPVGAALLNGPLDAPELTVVWVVAVVGAHFLPFAAAFDAPLFRPLALTLVAVAAVGAVGAVMLEAEGAAGSTAVTAGFVLMAFGVLGVRGPVSGSGRARPTPE